jgi:hypothetical protein
MEIAAILIIGIIAIVSAIFIGFHLTKSKHVRLKAAWGSVELEIFRAEPLPKKALPPSRARKKVTSG